MCQSFLFRETASPLISNFTFDRTPKNEKAVSQLNSFFFILSTKRSFSFFFPTKKFTPEKKSIKSGLMRHIEKEHQSSPSHRAAAKLALSVLSQ